MNRILNYIPQLIPYLFVTLEYVLLLLVIGTLLGFGLTVMKLGKNKALRRLAIGYTTVMRCTPSVILLFMVFYGLPMLLDRAFGINIQDVSTITFVIITFSLFLGGSQSEIMRSAYQAVDRGQLEAAVSVGLTGFQALYRIILPQALAVALPNIGNTILFLIKEGALGYMIGLIDIMGKAYLINGLEMQAHVLQVYIALSLVYWPLSICVEQLFKHLERRYSYTHIKPASRVVKKGVVGQRGI